MNKTKMTALASRVSVGSVIVGQAAAPDKSRGIPEVPGGNGPLLSFVGIRAKRLEPHLLVSSHGHLIQYCDQQAATTTAE